MNKALSVRTCIKGVTKNSKNETIDCNKDLNSNNIIDYHEPAKITFFNSVNFSTKQYLGMQIDGAYNHNLALDQRYLTINNDIPYLQELPISFNLTNTYWGKQDTIKSIIFSSSDTILVIYPKPNYEGKGKIISGTPFTLAVTYLSGIGITDFKSYIGNCNQSNILGCNIGSLRICEGNGCISDKDNDGTPDKIDKTPLGINSHYDSVNGTMCNFGYKLIGNKCY